MNISQSKAKELASAYLLGMIVLEPYQGPLGPVLSYTDSAYECHWFTYKFPDELRVGGDQVLGIDKLTGKVRFVGHDGTE
jgi:hypothetical protein